MAIDFPNSPTAGDLYTAGGKTWQWNSTYWSAYGTSPVLRASDAPPSSPNANDLWYETDTGRLFAYVGTAWVEVGNAVDIAGALQPGQVTALSAVTTLTSDDVFPVVDNPASATATNKITYGNLVTNVLASPGLTGTPTAPTASAGTNTTQVATTAFVTTAVSNIRVGSVPNFLVYFTGANGSAVNGAYLGYNTELYDDTNNVVSGVFTVPSGQAGVYQFNAASSVYNIGTTGYFRIQLVTSGSTGLDVNGSQTLAQGVTDVFSIVSGTVKLAVGDTVRVRFVVPATGLYSSGLTYNSFSGVRVA